jgi:hypothetical protein
MSHATLTPD